jgi:enamine deaminase RidA (YjgF/YER057c/UK114 family)
MVEVTKVKSGGFYEDKESYSRLVMVDNWIFMANTAGRNLTTRYMSEDAVEQAAQVFSNIERSLEQVGATLADVVRSHVHIQYREDAPAVMAYVGERFRGIDPASTVTCAPLGLPDFKVEIEVTAYRGAGAAKQNLIRFQL